MKTHSLSYQTVIHGPGLRLPTPVLHTVMLPMCAALQAHGGGGRGGDGYRGVGHSAGVRKGGGPKICGRGRMGEVVTTSG